MEDQEEKLKKLSELERAAIEKYVKAYLWVQSVGPTSYYLDEPPPTACELRQDALDLAFRQFDRIVSDYINNNSYKNNINII